jgi:hypothetical protein
VSDDERTVAPVLTLETVRLKRRYEIYIEDCPVETRGREVTVRLLKEDARVVPRVHWQRWCEKCGAGYHAFGPLEAGEPPCPVCGLPTTLFHFQVTKEGKK